MHALLCTFHCTDPEELEKGMGQMMDALASTKGLIQKTFIASGPQDWGGFYLFANREAADAYVAGEFFSGLKSLPIVQNMTVQHFEVEDKPSVMLGTPSKPLRQATSA